MKYTTEIATCCLCKSQSSTPYIINAPERYNGLGEKFSVVECSNCGMKYTSPRPDHESMQLFYPETAGYYQPEKVKKTKKGILKNITGFLLNVCWGYSQKRHHTWLKFIFYPLAKFRLSRMHIPQWKQGGKLLDLGCAWGEYLDQMRTLGWHVSGIEMSSKCVEYARNTLGLDVQCGDISPLPFPNESLDVVHLSMVLEHTYDPISTLADIHRILKKGGQLILSVPNISGFEAKLYKEYWYGLQVPQHLHHFTPETLSCALTMCGFTSINIHYHTFDRDMVASASYLESKFLWSIFMNKIIRKTLIKPFLILLALLGKTSRMSAYARK